MKRNKLFMTITALTAVFALGLQQYILIDNTPGNGMTPLQAVGRFLLFFTVLSNLFVAVSLTTLLVNQATAAGRFFSRPSSLAAIAVYIFIVGLIYNIVLRSIWEPQGWQKLADELLHVVVPLLFILYWFFFAPKHSVQWKHLLQWLIFPAVYLVYAMVRGKVEGFYVYPFLDANKLGIGRVMLNCAGMMLLFIITGLVAIALCKKLSGRTTNA